MQKGWYQIPKKKHNTDITPLYTEYQKFRGEKYFIPSFWQKIPNNLVKNTQDTIYPKPLAGPDF